MRLGFYLGGMSGPGSGSYTRMVALIDALAAEPLDIFVYGTSTQLVGLPSGPNVTLRPVLQSNKTLRRLMTPLTARTVARRDALDLLHFETLPVPRTRAANTILSIHHLPTSSALHSETPISQLRAQLRLAALKRAARRSNRIVTLTVWSRLEILRILKVSPGKVLSVHFSQPSQVPPRQKQFFQDASKYVLILGHIEKRKNIGTLIRAAAHPNWPPGVSLVVAGSDHGQRHSLEQLGAKLGVKVSFMGPVSDEEKDILLSDALCLAMPSFLEGFGIPIAEAVNRGTPALVSDQAALPEVVGTSNAVIGAMDVPGWAAKIRELDSDCRTREELLLEEHLHLARYSPEMARSAYLQCLST